MFGWFKKSRPPSVPHANAPLYFKDENAAFQYACEFLQTDLVAGAVLPALVLDARVEIGAEVGIKRNADGTQIAMLRVSSADGGYTVIAASASAHGPALTPGSLVAWQAGAPAATTSPDFPDSRSTWAGLILAKLLPEYTVGRGWAIERPFKP